MPRTLPSALEAARHLLASDQAWLLFVEVEIGADGAGGYHRLVKASRHVTADGVAWQAAGIGVEMGEEAASGDLSRFTVTVPNASRIAMRALELDGELLGRQVRVLMGNTANLSTLVELTRGTGVQATANEKAVSLSCGEGQASGVGQRVPGRSYDRRTFPQIVAGKAGQI